MGNLRWKPNCLNHQLQGFHGVSQVDLPFRQVALSQAVKAQELAAMPKGGSCEHNLAIKE